MKKNFKLVKRFGHVKKSKSAKERIILADGTVLHRIHSIRDIEMIEADKLGGYFEQEDINS